MYGDKYMIKLGKMEFNSAEIQKFSLKKSK
jgi:hypothetical protein